MSEENNGVDVDEFFDGAEESAAEVVEVGEEFTEKPAEEETPNVSVTDLLDDVVEEPEEKERAAGHVPMDKHLKLRQRAQAAEDELERLKSQTTRTDAENSGFEIDADDFVTGDRVPELIESITAKADAKAEARYEQRQAEELTKARVAKANADQEILKAERPDYLEVIAAMQNVQLSDKAKAEIRNADNAAEKAYEIGCQILNRQPAQKKTPTTTTPSNENNNEAEGGTTEEIFDSIFS